MNRRIDFNCDLGEGCGSDAEIIPLISAASIACGGHVGDEASMREALRLCARHGVAAGAHPSYPDREHFGRRELSMTPSDIHTLVVAQVSQLAAIAREEGIALRHVKPHGALYNVAARDRTVAQAIADAVRTIDPKLKVYALASSVLVDEARAAGLVAVNEAFAERGYTASGLLAHRGTPGAELETIEAALGQVRQLLRTASVTTVEGTIIPLQADSLCLHGDRPDAAAFAHALRTALERDGIIIAAPGDPA